MSLDRLLRPRSVAIVGASERPSVGRTLVEALDGIGFRGDVYPVNPRYESLLGRRCYASVADLPHDVDVLAFCVNHARVLEHMRLRPEADASAELDMTYVFVASANQRVASLAARLLANELEGEELEKHLKTVRAFTPVIPIRTIDTKTRLAKRLVADGGYRFN